MDSRPVWVAALAAVIISCAGELEDPESFTSLGPMGGTALSGGTGGMGAGTNSGTGGTGGMVAGAAGTASTPACDAEALLAQRCGTPACHSADAPQVDLASPDVAARLLDQSSPADTLCEGRVYIAADGSESLLLDKLEDAPPCGSKMPLVGTLDDEDIECLAQWVDMLVGS